MGLWEFYQNKAKSLPKNNEAAVVVDTPAYTPKVKKAWLDDGVPDDAVIIFPSRVHEPDLQGFDCPSNTLPYYLQIFGYWGFGLSMDKLGPKLVTTPRSSPNQKHVRFWLYHCWDQIKADYLAWQQAMGINRGKSQGKPKYDGGMGNC